MAGITVSQTRALNEDRGDAHPDHTPEQLAERRQKFLEQPKPVWRGGDSYSAEFNSILEQREFANRHFGGDLRKSVDFLAKHGNDPEVKDKEFSTWRNTDEAGKFILKKLAEDEAALKNAPGSGPDQGGGDYSKVRMTPNAPSDAVKIHFTSWDSKSEIAAMINDKEIKMDDLGKMRSEIEQKMADGYTPTSEDNMAISALQGSVQTRGKPEHIVQTMFMGQAMGISTLSTKSDSTIVGMDKNGLNINQAMVQFRNAEVMLKADKSMGQGTPPPEAKPEAKPETKTEPKAEPEKPPAEKPVEKPAEKPAASAAPSNLKAMQGSGDQVMPFNEKTQLMQAYMKVMGIETGPLDGREGPQTRAAMEQYAKKFPSGIENGNVAGLTQDEMLKHMQTRMKGSTEIIKDANMQTILTKANPHGPSPDVKAAQMVLNDMGFKDKDGQTLETDGLVGPLTRSAAGGYAIHLAQTAPSPEQSKGTQTMTQDADGKPKIVSENGKTPGEAQREATSPPAAKQEPAPDAPAEPSQQASTAPPKPGG